MHRSRRLLKTMTMSSSPAVELVSASRSVISSSLCSPTVLLFPSVFLCVRVIYSQIVYILAALLRAPKTADV